MIVNAPLQFPETGAYKIFGKSEHTEHLNALLQWCRPGADFLGFTDEYEPQADYRTILADFEMPGAAGLIRRATADENLILFPIPLGDFWTYWDFSLSNLDRLKFDGNVSIDREDFVDHLVDMHRVQKHPDTGDLLIGQWQYFITNQDKVQEHLGDIARVQNALSDLRSAQLYLKVLLGKPEQAWKHYVNSVFQSMQYMDYIDYSSCHTILNGGIATGIELPFFLSNCPDDVVIHNLDPFGYRCLTSYVRPVVDAYPDNFREACYAIGDTDGTVDMPEFPDNQLKPVYLHPDTSNMPMHRFPSIQLDSYVAAEKIEKVDLIKLDLEGCEPMALRGMEKTVLNHRPQLAISIYHDYSHYWDLPIWVMDRCPDYNFYLELYSFERFEMVLYAIPKERDGRGHVPK